ncbi:MAG TPA: CHAT domain-containing protein, partial [Novosphingobium sp.]|nr:CHAT domain-containing protein [Novosphingobium sp.]
ALSTLVIDAQSAWARSVALLGQNRPAEAAEMLALADRNFTALSRERVPQQRLLWLAARIERQRARLLLRNGDRAGALAALDKAIVQLRQAEDLGDSGPTLAQTQLERAAVLAGGNADRELVYAQFDDAISSLVAAGSDAGGLPPQTRSYLDALVGQAVSGGLAEERFFKTLQAAANPAIARQFVELQSLVAADPALGGKVQDLQELETEINRLRFEIDTSGDAGAAQGLRARRAELENQALALQTELTSNLSYAQVSDAPVPIDAVRAVLQPGEGYLKLSEVGGYVFGALIDADGTTIYRVARPAVEIAALAKAVRESITGNSQVAGRVPVFSVAGANALYKLLSGPVAGKLPRFQSLVVDASGVLDALPAGVLVTDDASPAAFARSRRGDAYDYTRIGFLARDVGLSTALSPRSLIVSRGLPASRAPYPFIGFAQHEPVSMNLQLAGQTVSIGNACEAEKEQVALLSRQLKPIDARELDMVTGALGVTGAVKVTGAEFSDTALRGRTDLDQFQVLHFATHGLTEGQWACSKAPPALVTSLGTPGSDGILSFDEIAKLRLDANLVVLSACDTAAGGSAAGARAAGQEQGGASLDGLVRAFLAARAQAVLSTYWPVSDAGETEALVTDFYRNARTDTIGQALRKAQNAMIATKASSHPKYWAPFFLVGDAQKMMLSG